MNKIVSLQQIGKIIKSLKTNGITVVLVGGCFDILHHGHLEYLKAAKKQGDILIVALENDGNVRRLKGLDRPVNQENIRATNLLNTGLVDYVIILPTLTTGDDYLKMVQTIKPDIIAITKGDPQTQNKQKQAKIIGSQVKTVIDRLPGFSTSRIIENYH
ncbi:MAG: adenylyltransferase/cytidyltransferase family protein [Candidatus Gottesmanbacteria bacterium]